MYSGAVEDHRDGAVVPAATAVLQAMGHPLRWRLLGALGRSDRTVHELTSLVDGPQNLVSYHLATLRDAGLVRSRRSSADGRDAYYSVDLAQVGAVLADTGAGLHPGLRLAPPPPPEVPTGARVLFLCTGNSARSPMAEALARVRSAGAVEARSAGSHPKAVHPEAVRVLRDDHGVDIADHEPTHLDDVADEHFDWVVTLCDRVREVCPELPSHPEAVHWSLPNPTEGAAADAEARFRRTATELEARIGFLLALIADRAAAA